MTSKNVDIAREYFQAVQKGDLAKVGELLDEEIVWHQPGAATPSSRCSAG